MPQRTRILTFLETFLLIFFTSLFLFKTIAKAQVDLKDFHSLRPQPGTVSDQAAPLTQMCGNSLVFTDQITVSPLQGSCNPPNAEGNFSCTFKVPRSIAVSIDLSGAKFPIMGNTEDVVNKSKNEDDISDADKMNEYVSWYLNGTTNKAGYPFLDVNDPVDLAKIVNFSGPIRKLLPWDLQIYPKLEIIDRVDKKELYNQIVGCVDILKRPVPCNQASSNKRVKDWKESALENLISSPLDLIKKLLGKLFDNPAGWLTSLVYTWTKAIPPLREDYDKYKDYYVDYKEWRGRFCAKGPFNLVFCYGDIFKADYWADLFPYIPFTSTEDKEGSIEYTFTQTTSGDTEIIDPELNSGSAVFLYFAHMQETSEAAELLQTTFSPKDITVVPIMSDIQKVDIPTDCRVIKSTTSPGGDSLYPSSNTMEVFLTYKAGFECQFNINQSDKTCTRNVNLNISTVTNTPLADDVWSKLVAGSNSVVRKFLPKTGSNSSLGSLIDVPASTSVVYTSDSLENSGGINTLYFPHIGGVSNYFLKGIQTLLRPKGYGEDIEFGWYQDLSCSAGSLGSIPKFVQASSQCSLSNISAGYSSIPSLPPTLIAAFESAAESYQIPPSLLLGLMFGEGGFDRTSWGWVYTEENVQEWVKGCSIMPHCDVNSSIAEGPFQWIPSSWDEHKGAVNIIDSKREPNRCNLLDQIYAAAKKVSAEANGPSIPNPRAPHNFCFGINFNTGSGGYSTCGDWDLPDVNTGIRQWSGSCLSNIGSGTLGSLAGYCTEPSVCETYQACFEGTGSCTSYYAYIWSVYNHYKSF